MDARRLCLVAVGICLLTVVVGMEWAVKEDAHIISMSLGGQCFDGESAFFSEYIDPIENAKTSGTTVVAAIGNDGDGCTGSPGNVYDSISVGATDDKDTVASLSGGETINTPEAWGEDALDHWPEEYVAPDLVAPGVRTLSAFPEMDGEYGTMSGTSMAAPHVSGAIALLYASTDDRPSPDRTLALFEATATDIGEEPTRQGAGRIDVQSAIQLHTFQTDVEPTIDAPASANVSESVTVGVANENGDGLDAYDDLIEGYEWTLGNETVTTNEPIVDHAFDGSALNETVDITVQIKDVEGETQNATTTIDVVDERPPEAAVSANRTAAVEAGLDLVELNASASTDNHEIDRYEWAFDDGTTETTTTPTVDHSFQAIGPLEPTVTVVDAAGNTNTTSIDVEVVDTTPPEAALSANRTEDVDAGLDAVELNASASTDNHEIASYEWAFDDNTTETTTSPTVEHIFNSTGTFEPSVTVVDAADNTDTTATEIEVVADDDDGGGGGGIGLPDGDSGADGNAEATEPTAVIDIDTDTVSVGDDVTLSGAQSAPDSATIGRLTAIASRAKP